MNGQMASFPQSWDRPVRTRSRTRSGCCLMHLLTPCGSSPWTLSWMTIKCLHWSTASVSPCPSRLEFRTSHIWYHCDDRSCSPHPSGWRSPYCTCGLAHGWRALCSCCSAGRDAICCALILFPIVQGRLAAGVNSTMKYSWGVGVGGDKTACYAPADNQFQLPHNWGTPCWTIEWAEDKLTFANVTVHC